MTIHTTALIVVHVMIVAWSKMMVAYAGHLSERNPFNTNKQWRNIMGTMTLASKVEVEYCLSYNMTRKDIDDR